MTEPLKGFLYVANGSFVQGESLCVLFYIPQICNLFYTAMFWVN